MKTTQTFKKRFFRLAALVAPSSPGAVHLSPLQAAEPAAVKATVTVQAGGPGKRISPDLLGVFFEDINYGADGGLYAELLQNRSFEYSNQDQREWNSLTAWELVQRADGKGAVTVEATQPLNPNNPHYAVLKVEQGGSGVGLMNSGFDGIPIKAGEQYDFSCFAIPAVTKSGFDLFALGEGGHISLTICCTKEN